MSSTQHYVFYNSLSLKYLQYYVGESTGDVLWNDNFESCLWTNREGVNTLLWAVDLAKSDPVAVLHSRYSIIAKHIIPIGMGNIWVVPIINYVVDFKGDIQNMLTLNRTLWNG